MVPGRPRPEGWAGKVWAMEQGLQAAAPVDGYVLFTDADIEWAPGALRSLVAAAERDDRALVSQMALLRAQTGWERIVVPAFVANIKQRSEKQRDIQKSIESFVDLGVIAQIATENNQIVYGRRGTGKTHLFNYLGAELEKDLRSKVVYIDCRTLGSSSQFTDFTLPIENRCLALFKDILAEVHDALLERIIEHPTDKANDVLDLLSRLGEAVVNPIEDRKIDSLSSKTPDLL